MSAKILVVEDSKDYRLMLKHSLGQNHQLTFCQTGQEALDIIPHHPFDLYIIDVILPDLNGLQICNFIKSQAQMSNKPVILLTGQDSVDDKIKGFDLGADDYVTKPFHTKELEARVRAKLRNSPSTSDFIYLEDLEINLSSQQVKNTKEQTALELTPVEFRLLCFFSHRISHVVSRESILNAVWPGNLNVSERTIDSHISNLRKKISGHKLSITAVHGCGYRFSTHSSKIKKAG